MSLLELALKVAGVPEDEPGLKAFMTDLGEPDGSPSDNFMKRNIGDRVIGGRGIRNLHYQTYIKLDEDQRKRVYQSEYEPGHPEPNLPSESEGALLSYLEQTYQGSSVDLFKEIKALLKNLTDTGFEEHVKRDRKLAYRIVTLLYRIKRFRPKVNSLLLKDFADKCQYEFRHEYPMHDSKARENTAILSEIRCRLAFMMTPNQQNKYLTVCEYLVEAQGYVADYFIAKYKKLLCSYVPAESSKRVNQAIDEWAMDLTSLEVPVSPVPLHIQLNFELQHKEYQKRIQSSRLVAQDVLQQPLNLEPYASETWQNRTETECLTYLTRSEDVLRLKPSLDSQAECLEELVTYPGSDIVSNHALKMLLKALILHDEKRGMSVKSKAYGVDDMPDSPMAVLKKAAKLKKADKKSGSMNPNLFPEALSKYWDCRIRLLIQQQRNGIEKGCCIFEHIVDIEHRVAQTLIDYLKQGGVQAFDQLYELYISES